MKRLNDDSKREIKESESMEGSENALKGETKKSKTIGELEDELRFTEIESNPFFRGTDKIEQSSGVVGISEVLTGVDLKEPKESSKESDISDLSSKITKEAEKYIESEEFKSNVRDSEKVDIPDLKVEEIKDSSDVKSSSGVVKSSSKKKSTSEKKKREKPVSWRKVRKQQRLIYKVIHQEPRPNLFLYLLEVLLVMPLEIGRKFWVFLRGFIVTLVILGLIVGTVGVVKFYPYYDEWNTDAERIVNAVDKSDFAIDEASTIYASDGSVLAIVKEEAETSYLDYDDIPQYAIDAFVAVEDRSFWTNPGYDIKGIAAAGVEMLTGAEKARGASTITQQLVKLTYLTSERSIERKAKEILISRALTKQFSKRQIMEFYVNNVCYANGIYGLSGAAKAYFNCGVDELSLSQIAYLCAIPNRPEYYDPYKNPDNAIERRNKILDDMVECEYITRAQATKAKAEKITIEKPEQVFNNYATSFAVDCAIEYLMKLDGFDFKYAFDTADEYNTYHDEYNDKYAEAKHKLYTGGYKVYTSLDMEVYDKLQGILDEQLAFDSGVDEETGVYKLQGAIACIDNDTGNIIAVVGGRSQESDTMTYSLNRAFQSYRQPGSTFKPIAVYAPALQSEYGFTAETKVTNISVSEAKKKGVNAQKLGGSVYTLRNAVEYSRNGCAWQVFDKITPKYGMQFVTNMEFFNICPSDYYNASSLGGLTYGTNVVEMASAYATLANHGDFRTPTCITSIKNNKGREVFYGYSSKEIYTDKAADDMVDILKGVLKNGTASKLNWSKSSKIEAFAKTGTTNDSKDGWLCGSTPYYSIAVWVGYDTPKTLSNLYGATYPGQIWKSSMLAVTEGLDEAKFERNEDDESYVNATITPSGTSSGYYSYLEGRSDSEVLSDGYTVADYRSDRVIGESVTAIINQINALDMSVSGADTRLEQLYAQGCGVVDTIYSRKYTSEMQGKLDSAYKAKK